MTSVGVHLQKYTKICNVQLTCIMITAWSVTEAETATVLATPKRAVTNATLQHNSNISTFIKQAPFQ